VLFPSPWDNLVLEMGWRRTRKTRTKLYRLSWIWKVRKSNFMCHLLLTWWYSSHPPVYILIVFTYVPYIIHLHDHDHVIPVNFKLCKYLEFSVVNELSKSIRSTCWTQSSVLLLQGNLTVGLPPIPLHLVQLLISVRDRRIFVVNFWWIVTSNFCILT